MSITQENIARFRAYPLPKGVVLDISPGAKILRGKEALVTRAITNEGTDVAFKWYAKLNGMDLAQLVEYGTGVNRDEDLLWNATLPQMQVPNSSFFISSYDQTLPQLFAIQPWVEGRLLKDISFQEIISNPILCRSLAQIFRGADTAFRETGRYPDLIGGETIKIFGKEIADPRQVSPFNSKNIMVNQDSAILFDARFLHLKPGSLKHFGAKLHHELSLLLADALTRLHPGD